MKCVSQKFPQSKALRQLLYTILGFAFGLAVFAGLAYGVMPTQRGVDSPLIDGSFAVIGHDSGVMTNADLAGHPYLVFFGYTHCSDFCPMVLSEISTVFKELGRDKEVTALFVTVDPESDSPEVLKAYLKNFDSRIVGLTGDPAKLAAFAKAFRVFAKGPGDFHNGIVYLMDKQGRFVSTFNLQRPPQQAARELEHYL
jgi:protein SCO1/2